MSATHPETSLIPYLRGELSGREHARMVAHLEGCAACRTQADVLTLTLELVARQVAELPTPDWTAYRRELRHKLAARTAPARRWWQVPAVWGSCAAGVAAVALFTVVAMHRGGNPAASQAALGPLAFADPAVDELGRTDVGLLRNYPMVERLDMLDNDNYDVIEHLDELAPASQTNEIQHL